uniref:Gag-Pol polyprotein n=1 Tax=Tanacetum cinerariifolium TaxID=118510 RepID=A0A6L2KT93_TANCI|nr:hypothetical protein [Tanacetum cinerariifolium]
MSTQQGIYAAGSESRPPIVNKENYVPWSSRLLRYAKSRPNGKLIHNSIINGPYFRRMIPEPGDANREVTMTETFHVQIDDELTDKELKQIEADDQAIQTILLGLPEDIYAAIDSCETAQEIWLRVQQMMKGSNIRIQEKKAKLFNEWKIFTSNEWESIESYYHRFLKLMTDLKRNKHFPEKIASNIKFLNNLQPEWSRHKEVDELKAERLANTQDPLALMENSNNPYAFPVPHQDQSSFNQNYLQQPMPNPEDITDPTTAMNMALALMDKAFKLNYSTPTNNNQRISSNPRNRQIAQSSMNMGQDRQMQMVVGNGGNQFRQYAGQNTGNLSGYNDVQNIRNQVIQNAVQNPRVQNIRNPNGLIGVQGNRNQNQIGNGHYARNCTVRPKRRDAAYLQTQLLIAQKEEAGIQLQAKEYDLMAAAADLDKIEEVNANCILMANLQQASTLGTQTDNAHVYDSDVSADVHEYENCYDNEIFNMFTQGEQYTELLEPIPEPLQVPQNDNDVISEAISVEQDEKIVEQHPVNFEETRALYDSLYQNLSIEVEKVNSINRKLKETNADLTTELARFKNQTRCFEISQEKYDILERCYQQSVYQEQCLSKKINALHLSTEKTLQLAQESREKMKQLNKEIKPANYTKLNHLSGVFVPQTAKSHEELYFSNISKTANVSKSISIPNDDFSDDTTPSVARKFPNEVKSTIVTLQRVVKHRMTIEPHNWSSSAHQELYKIIKDENFPIVNQVDARVQNFEIQILKEAAKVVGDFKSLANEAALAKHKALELEIKRLLKAVATYKNLFDSISVSRTQTKTIIASLQNELQSTISKNAKLRTQLFKKASDQKDNTHDSSKNTKFAKQSILGKLPMLGEIHALSKPVTSNSVPTPQESKVMNNDKVIAPRMVRINPFKTSREEKHVPNTVRASVRTKPINVSQTPVFTKKDVHSNSNGLSFIGVDNTAKTKRTQPRSNSKNNKVPYVVKSSYKKNKEADVEENHRNLLSSSNKKHVSSKCNNVKLATHNVYSKVVCAMCKQCLISINHDVCLLNYVNGINSQGKKQNENVSNVANQKKHKARLWKPKNVGSKERLASPKPSSHRSCFRWSPTGRFFDLKGKIIASSESESQSDCSNGDNACSSNPLEPMSKRFPNSTFSVTGQNLFDTLLIPLLFKYKPMDKGDHGDNECVIC